MIRSVLIALAFLWLAGCQISSPFAGLPEPWHTSFLREIHEQPNSEFSRACRGDQAALHAYFAQSIQPLDGADAETFNASMIAFYKYLGRSRFVAAVAREPANIQQAMGPVVELLTKLHDGE